MKDGDGNAVTDPHLVDQNLSQAEAGMFYVVIYAAMVVLCLMTAGIIARRLGGVYYTMYSKEREYPMGSGKEGIPDEITKLINK